MTAKVLTVQAVERLKPDAKARREIPDAGMPGLYLTVHPTGRKSWAVRYRFGGRTRRMVLGPYPALDLSAARDRARAAVQTLHLGRDPGEEKVQAAKVARLAAPERDLVSSVARDFVERHLRKHTRARTAYLTEGILKREVLPFWGARRVQDIGRRDVLDLLDSIVDRGAPVAANRAFAVIRQLFNWAVTRSIIEVSPCASVKAPTKETPRDRVLTDEELRLVWLAADRVGYPFGPFVQILILTGQRLDEVAGISKAEIPANATEWHIPAKRAKNGRATSVPLSELAQAVLQSLPPIRGEFLFTTAGDKPITSFSWAKKRLDAAITALNGVPLPNWTYHDLRRTAASGMARLGTNPHVIEAVLNHRSGTISGVAAVYNRYAYLEEKRAALTAWSTNLEALTISGGKSATAKPAAHQTLGSHNG